jgi:hypothetical protein
LHAEQFVDYPLQLVQRLEQLEHVTIPPTVAANNPTLQVFKHEELKNIGNELQV